MSHQNTSLQNKQQKLQGLDAGRHEGPPRRAQKLGFQESLEAKDWGLGRRVEERRFLARSQAFTAHQLPVHSLGSP